MTTDIVIRPDEHRIVLVGSGEVLELDTPAGCGQALDALRALKEQVDAAVRVVTEAAVGLSLRDGTKTFVLDSGRKLSLSADTATVVDADELRAALLAAGMPDGRVDEIVVPNVTYKVNRAKANAAASANPAYREALDRCTSVQPRTVYASLK